jgi:hypothetical protein
MKRFLLIFSFLVTACLSAHSQAYGDLPAGSIGTVNQTATGTYQLFSYSWTAPTTGADYFGIALRQDPGYWSVGSFKLTAQGSSTNLLNNPNLQYGGTTNTQYGLQAPADWGLWYQSGNGIPPAAGQYYAPGSGWMGSTTLGGGVNTGTSGSWIDGAVGTYDGIYQGFSATAGTTYNFSFYASGTNPYSNPSIMIGVYAGACSGGIFSCTPTSNAFTVAATPQDTQGTGGAPPPPPPPPPPSSGPQFTNLRFGQYQVADSQWNVSSCTQTNTCQIYSTNPGTAYRIPWTSGRWNWQPGQYIQFSTTGNSANPYEAKVYNSDGTLAGTLGTGHILSMGTDSNGHSLFFFVGNDNNTGQLFSTNYGFSGNGGYTWTGTLNPNTSQVDTFASSGSTTPLASGQSIGGSSAPTVVSTQSTTTTTTSTSGGTTYTYNQPVIITTWSDGTTTTANNGNPTLIRTVSTDPFNANLSNVNRVNTFATRPTNDSKVYINQVGDYNLIQVDQSGTKNNFVKYQGNGNDNTVSVLQSSTSSVATNYVDISIGSAVSSNNNNISVQQTSTSGAKAAFISVLDNNNAITLRQQDSGNHWADVSVSGGNKTVDITQQGSAGHMASVQLTGPQPASLSLQQSGSTQQFYSIQSNCTTAGGCAPITVQQGR